MHEVVSPVAACGPDRRLSHVCLMDVPRYPRPLMVTDAAVNRSPDVEVKRDIIQNAIDLAHVMVSTSPASLCYPRWRR